MIHILVKSTSPDWIRSCCCQYPDASYIYTYLRSTTIANRYWDCNCKQERRCWLLTNNNNEQNQWAWEQYYITSHFKTFWNSSIHFLLKSLIHVLTVTPQLWPYTGADTLYTHPPSEYPAKDKSTQWDCVSFLLYICFAAVTLCHFNSSFMSKDIPIPIVIWSYHDSCPIPTTVASSSKKYEVRLCSDPIFYKVLESPHWLF